MLAPSDVVTIYGIQGLYDAGFDGGGQTLVIVGQAKLTDLSDTEAFRRVFGLTAKDPKIVYVPNSVPQECAPTDNECPGNLVEANLDLQWAGAVAKNAQLIYVGAEDANVAAQYAIDQNLAPVVSESFGSCEYDAMGTDYGTTLQSIARLANIMGITWIVSTGDNGAVCRANSAPPGTTYVPGVQLPASVPEVTGVGGTEFDDASGGYWSISGEASSYIPEKAWSGSGGGTSVLFHSRPSWQSGSGVPDNFGRNVPDVALSASGSQDPYFICYYGRCASGNLPSDPNHSGVGGTSASAPVFAAIVTLVDQYLVGKGIYPQTGLGNINPVLYQLAAGGSCAAAGTQNANCTFHDIQAGGNEATCDPSLAGCSTGRFGYTAHAGYDQVTGLGSVDAFHLAQLWSSSAPLPPSVTAKMVTKSLDPSSCSVPSPATTFLTTDPSVFLWFSVAGARAGDIASAAWFAPNGTLYGSTSWNALTSGGSWCFPGSVDLAGHQAASMPGNWMIRVTWNGAAAFTLNFTVQPPVRWITNSPDTRNLTRMS